MPDSPKDPLSSVSQSFLQRRSWLIFLFTYLRHLLSQKKWRNWNSIFGRRYLSRVSRKLLIIRFFDFNLILSALISFSYIDKHWSSDIEVVTSFREDNFFSFNVDCVKNARIRSYSGPHFPVFGLNTEKYSVSLHIQSESRKMRTRITPNTSSFYAVVPNSFM